jgi:4-carboxymuconolactone decarboxylase
LKPLGLPPVGRPTRGHALLTKTLLIIGQEGTTQRSESGPAAGGFEVRDSTVLFRDLWLRPDLAPRDRSLVTVSSLIASGQVAQITYHLNRAMDNGLTQPQAGEVLTHLAFYVGWPNVFSALPVAKDVFEKRPH